MFRGALVGFGAVAENGHLPVLANPANGFEIVAVAEQSPERRALAEKLLPGARVFESLTELLETERRIDFADIATPPTYHFGAAKSCLEAGLHVLCEKPLVFTRKEFEVLLRTAQKKDRALFTVHNWKYAPPIVKARELISAGKIGDVLHAELHVLRSQPSVAANSANWRQNPKLSGGGIMADHGWHNFYLIHCLTGGKPLSINAACSYPKAGSRIELARTEDCCSCQIELEGRKPADHMTAEIYLTWRSPIRKNWGAVYGKAGVIEIRDDIVILERKGEAPAVFETGEKLSGGSAHPTWMAGLVAEFAAALAKPELRADNLREAETCVALTEAGYESALTGGTVLTEKLQTFTQG